MRLDEKKQYILWDSNTGEDIDTFDTRREATAERDINERNGEFQTRIRTIIVKDDK